MLRVTDKQYWMHPTLKTRLDTLIYNTKKGFQFMLVVSGSKKTRVGKTVLGSQVAYYMAYELERKFGLDNVTFSGSDLIEKAKILSPAVLLLDESRADFSSIRTIYEETQKLIDFFNESGIKNNVIILILPDFFDLTKAVAIGLSEYLINCYVVKKRTNNERGEPVEEYIRGYFGFYDDETKNKLYETGYKQHNYNAHSWNFWGNFREFWVFDEVQYNIIKKEFVDRDRELSRSKSNIRILKYKAQRDALIKYLNKDLKYSQDAVAQVLTNNGFPCTQPEIARTMAKYNK